MKRKGRKEQYVISILAVACVAVLLSTTIVAMNTCTTTTVTDSSDVRATGADMVGANADGEDHGYHIDFWYNHVAYHIECVDMGLHKTNNLYVVSAEQYVTDLVIPDTITRDGKTYIVQRIANEFHNRATASAYTMVIGNNVKVIENYAFKDFTNLRSITIGSGLEEIGDNAFEHCANLRDVTINSDVKRIGKEAFHDCYSLASMHIKSVGLIDKRAFANAANFDLTIDGDCRKIEINAFQEAYIKSFTVHGNIGVIVDKAFKGCDRLVNVDIGSIALLGNEAFRDCSSLKTLYIGYVSNNIESKAFAGCGSLSKITFGIIEHLDGSAFDGITFKDYNGNVLDHTAHNIGNNGFNGANSVLVRC